LGLEGACWRAYSYLHNLTFIFKNLVNSPPQGTYTAGETDDQYIVKDGVIITKIKFGIFQDREVYRLCSMKIYEGETLLKEARNLPSITFPEQGEQSIEIAPTEQIVSAKVHFFKAIPTAV